MTKVAYVFGFSGSGKCYIAKTLQDMQVIEVDDLRDIAARRFSPHDTGLWRKWERRRDLFRTPDITSKFSQILAEHWHELSGERPILAEGFDLGHDDWRKAFRAALELRGITITDERKFWIHPPAEVVLKNRRDRDREDQRSETLEDVCQHGNWYHERVSHHSNCRYEDAKEAILAIRQFLVR